MPLCLNIDFIKNANPSVLNSQVTVTFVLLLLLLLIKLRNLGRLRYFDMAGALLKPQQNAGVINRRSNSSMKGRIRICSVCTFLGLYRLMGTILHKLLPLLSCRYGLEFGIK